MHRALSTLTAPALLLMAFAGPAAAQDPCGGFPSVTIDDYRTQWNPCDAAINAFSTDPYYLSRSTRCGFGLWTAPTTGWRAA